MVKEASRQTRIAVDLESNGFHHYPERICLIQLSFPGRVYLIDPISIGDASALSGLLEAESVEKVFHSADYDLRSLDREWGVRVANLFDTSIAAAFCGIRNLGLGTVTNEVLGVSIPKSKRLQRADWTQRPLSAEALSYASEDVLHLLKLRTELGRRLDSLGRTDWVAEECVRLSRVRHRPTDPESAYLGVKGSRSLDGRGLAVLKAVHGFREREALRLDRPPFKVFSDAALVGLTEASESDMASVKGLGRYSYPPGATRLRRVLQEGRRARPLTRPRRTHVGPRQSAEERAAAAQRLPKLKQWRTALGDSLDLDPALLWPMASIERLSRDTGTIDAELEAPEVRRWQRREFGDSLRRLLPTDPFR